MKGASRVIIASLVVATLVVALAPATGLAACTTDRDCKFHRRCVDGKCVNPALDPARNKKPEAAAPEEGADKASPTATEPAAVGASASALPAGGLAAGDDAVGTVPLLLDLVAEVALEMVLVAVLLGLALLFRWHGRRERRVFADPAGRRALLTVQLLLDAGAELAGASDDVSEVLARLLELEAYLKAGRKLDASALPSTYAALVRHPRFDDFAKLGAAGDDPSSRFEGCRALAR